MNIRSATLKKGQFPAFPAVRILIRSYNIASVPAAMDFIFPSCVTRSLIVDIPNTLNADDINLPQKISPAFCLVVYENRAGYQNKTDQIAWDKTYAT